MNSTVNCYTISIDTDDMPNKHLDHLEDLVFFGRREVTNAVNEVMNHPKLSVKWDGAPAIVFGTDPRNGKFFVGTKSGFNKIKVKIMKKMKRITMIKIKLFHIMKSLRLL